MAGPRIAPSGFLAFALSAVLSGGCIRNYRAVVPHLGQAPGAVVGVRAVSTAPGGEVDVSAAYRLAPGTALSDARLAPMASPPCTEGVKPLLTWTLDTSVGFSGITSDAQLPRGLAMTFSVPGDANGRERQLLSRPAALDLVLLYANAPAGCLRVPLVDAGEAPEWSNVPAWSLGLGWRVVAPLERIYGVDATSMVVVRFGRWLGPVRLRAELAGGGAFAHSANANLIGYAYGAGLVADTLLFSVQSFGLGVAAGYDYTGISYGANIDSFSHEGAGYAGSLYGPRAGLVFGLVPGRPPGPAFRARPDASSASLEIFGAALSNTERSAVGALWFLLSLDGGFDEPRPRARQAEAFSGAK